MSTTQAILTIAVMAFITFLTRALPFLLFDRGERAPKVVLYLGKVLPPAVIAMLIVYCLRGMSITLSTDVAALARWLPQVIAVIAATTSMAARSSSASALAVTSAGVASGASMPSAAETAR